MTDANFLIRGRELLVLDEPGKVYRVESGAAAVYSAGGTHSELTGSRHYLFSCGPGDLIFTCGAAGKDDELELLAVGVPEATLVEVKGEEVRTDEVEVWVHKICNSLEPDLPLDDAERIEADMLMEVEAEEAVRLPGNRISWLEISSGCVSLMADPSLELQAQPDRIPLDGRFWILAEVPATVCAHSGPTDVLAGLERLHELLIAHLAAQAERERSEQFAQQVERSRLEQLETDEVVDELRGILTSRPSHAVTKETDLLTALSSIGRELGIKFKPAGRSESFDRPSDPVDAIARASRVRYRRVKLSGSWWKGDCGPLLAYLAEDQRPVALIPVRGRYRMLDPNNQSAKWVGRRVHQQLMEQAVSFVRPLPEEQTSSLYQLSLFTLRPYRRELVLILSLALLVALLGMVVPMATRLIVDGAIPDANTDLVYQLAAGLLAMAIGQTALSFSQGLLSLRLSTGMTADLQAAVIDRLLRLPSRFFRGFNSGDLMNRAMMITEVSGEIGMTVIGAALTSAMSMVNLFLCYYYSPSLAWIALATACVTSLLAAVVAWMIRVRALELEQLGGKLFGFAVQLVSGVPKLRVAGAEQRAFNQWARRYTEQLRLVNGIQRLDDWASLVNELVSTASFILLFFFAVRLLDQSGSTNPALSVGGPVLLTLGTFLAFRSAFDSLVGGAVSLSNTIVDVTDSFAKRTLIKPLLEEKPENDSAKSDPGRLVGKVSVQNAVFRYREDGPLVLNDVSIHAEPGEFIAVVGPSGSGKSTLLRLLLGFETLESGTVYFDNQDLAGLDPSAVRRQIGAVLQSAHISAGSILDNIALGSPVTQEEAMEAIQDAGFDQDLAQMPMGLHTVVSEGATNLSGGQRQRLLIARALLLQPKLLVFDEATSALDNRTQSIVTNSIQRRSVTRIVVAHRLSTIRDADRIYVIDHGQVVQVGTYADLVDQAGVFRQMVQRQLA